MPLNVLVVGAGPGGVAAAVQLRRLGAGVRWWDRTGTVGGLLRHAWRVENWPGVPVGTSGEACCARLHEHADAFGLIPEPVEVTGCLEDGSRVEVSVRGGAPESFDAVVWAVGTAPRPWPLAAPGLPVVDGFCDLTAGVRRLLVVGGGEAACDGALHAASARIATCLVVRSERLRARGRLAELVMAHPALDRRFSTEVTALQRVGAGVRVTLRGHGIESAHEADAVLFCGGRESRLAALGLRAPSQGSLRLSPRQWVIGDARLGGLGQACIALGDGLLAAGELVCAESTRWG